MVPDEAMRQQICARIVEALQWTGPVFSISAIRSEGTQSLCYALMQLIDEMKQAEA